MAQELEVVEEDGSRGVLMNGEVEVLVVGAKGESGGRETDELMTGWVETQSGDIGVEGAIARVSLVCVPVVCSSPLLISLACSSPWLTGLFWSSPCASSECSSSSKGASLRSGNSSPSPSSGSWSRSNMAMYYLLVFGEDHERTGLSDRLASSGRLSCLYIFFWLRPC